MRLERLMKCLFHLLRVNHSLGHVHIVPDKTDALLARILSFLANCKKQIRQMLFLSTHFCILRTTPWDKNSLQRWQHWVSCPYIK